ncbi:MAG: hypothetical protein K2F57_01290 [Candidatus Gastranaerophilales bacterium]|nr:hypothetical protein [Candidatus Gastranaerophilales bacterium]
MLDIKLELEILLLRKGLSMRKLISRLREKGCDISKSGSMSVQLKNKRVRFQIVQEILDYPGYEIVIKEK